MSVTRQFPIDFVAWFTKWAGHAPVIDDDEDEDAYAAWHAGRELGHEEGRREERDNREPDWRDE